MTAAEKQRIHSEKPRPKISFHLLQKNRNRKKNANHNATPAPAPDKACVKKEPDNLAP
jgi:hypothetical protein